MVKFAIKTVIAFVLYIMLVLFMADVIVKAPELETKIRVDHKVIKTPDYTMLMWKENPRVEGYCFIRVGGGGIRFHM